MRRRCVATAVLLVALLPAIGAARAEAHAGLVASDPAYAAELGASPAEVTLTFSEQPEASLSEVKVRDGAGATVAFGRPHAVSGDQLSLAIPVPRLARGVYTVEYRTVSAVDGHATSGTYAFGVRASPTGVATTATTTTPDATALEVVARWLLLGGLVALLGAAVAGAAGFGGREGTDLRLATGGWLVAIAGVVLLAVAQRRTAGSSLGELLETPVGEALIWRGVTLVFSGAALLYAARRPPLRRVALGVAAAASLATIAVHVDAGHAAAGGWSAALSVTTQVAHFAAAGVWFGGLAALLLGLRGAPSAEKAAAVRRFAVVAATALVVVLVTGTVRAIDELSSWGELLDTGYGRAVVAKLVLIALIAALAARNRNRGVPAAATDLSPVRRTSRIELGLAVAALATAALLGTLAPPVTGQAGAVPPLSASGADFAASVRVRLTASSDEPGPNRFVLEVDDYETGEPVEADRAGLRFRSLDDPEVAPSSLELRPAGEGAYAAPGTNLTLDGRWAVTALIERDGGSVQVPLELDLPLPQPVPSVLRLPGAPPEYTLQVEYGLIRVVPDPELAGPSNVYVRIFGGAADLPAPTDRVVVTGAAGDEPPEQKPVRRLTRSRFVAEVDLESGPYTIAVVARRDDGARMRGAVELDVPGD